MLELGIDLIDRIPQKLASDLAAYVDIVVTMGCGDQCPYGGRTTARQRLDKTHISPGRPITERPRRAAWAFCGLVGPNGAGKDRRPRAARRPKRHV